MVNSWNPDLLVSTGDMSNIRGNRAETYKGLLVRTATPVTAPVMTTSTLQQAITARASAQTVQVSAVTAVGTYALNFDGPRRGDPSHCSHNECSLHDHSRIPAEPCDW